jgi:zinc transport system permease protein
MTMAAGMIIPMITPMCMPSKRTMPMLDDFLIRAALAGIGVALAAGPLGCFVIWRRMAYIGDASAHAAVLGVALAFGFSISVFAGVLVTALAMAVLVSILSHRGHALDTVLGVLAHSALAVGLVAISFLNSVRIDLNAYLFGDILAVGRGDIALIWGGAAVVLALLWWRWGALLTTSMSQELARAAGFNPRREELILTIALALVVAVAIKIVGALLIAAMLIIPAAAARGLSDTPEKMAMMAAGLASASVLGGLWMSLGYDTPAGPSIVVVAVVWFVLSLVVGGALRGKVPR